MEALKNIANSVHHPVRQTDETMARKDRTMRNTIGVVALLGVFGLAPITGCASDPTTRSAGRVLDDSVITAKVKAALVDAPEVDALEVNVNTYRGAVQLSGFVDSSAEAQRAADVARSVEGVTSVKNSLQVTASGT
jgi:hyperosmotically inducible periplasmic protein